MIITIDGPAGSGKSTLSKKLAKKLSIQYLNSGAFYRAISYIALYNKDVDEEFRILPHTLSSYCTKTITNIDWNAHVGVILVNTCQNNTHIRHYVLFHELFSKKIDYCAAQISTHTEIRRAINQRIRDITMQGNWIIEGRDAGSNIYPDADLSFYLDATLEARAARRKKQYKDASTPDYEDIMNNIRQRDSIDKSKGADGLIILDKYIYLNTTKYSIEDILEKMYNTVKRSIY